MKTFKDAKAEMDSIDVVGDCDGEPYFYITTTEAGNMAQIRLDNSTAPALAHAILEAAGTPMNLDVSLGKALYHLDAHVTLQAKATAEAKEQAELEAEALELANSAVLVVGNPPYPSIGHMSDTSLRKWLAVARKAREMAKEAPSA